MLFCMFVGTRVFVTVDPQNVHSEDTLVANNCRVV